MNHHLKYIHLPELYLMLYLFFFNLTRYFLEDVLQNIYISLKQKQNVLNNKKMILGFFLKNMVFYNLAYTSLLSSSTLFFFY